MKKAKLRELLKQRENKGFTFTVDDVDNYKEGAIEKIIKASKPKRVKKGDKNEK